MIIQARQSFRIEAGDEVLEMRNGDIKTVDDKWEKHSFLQALLNDKKVIYYVDKKDSTVEKANAEAKAKAIADEQAQELNRLLDQAKETARQQAEQVAQQQGLDVKRKNALIKTYVDKAVKETTEAFNKKEDA